MRNHNDIARENIASAKSDGLAYVAREYPGDDESDNRRLATVYQLGMLEWKYANHVQEMASEIDSLRRQLAHRELAHA